VLPLNLPCGLGFTITTDLLDVATLHVPLTVTKYEPAALIVFVVVNVFDVVVPTNTPPSVNHWYVNGVSPAAVMLIVAVVPSLIVCVAIGCAVITAGKLVLIVADPVVVPPPY
jgi:hypothetical protein